MKPAASASLGWLWLAAAGLAAAADPAAQARQAGRLGHRDLAIKHAREALDRHEDPALRRWLTEAEAARRPSPQPTPGEDAVPGLGRVLDDPLPGALAAWAEGPPAAVAAQVSAHNLAVAKSQQILYLFYPCGRLERGTTGIQLLWDPAPAVDLAARIGGEVRILPWIQASGRPFNGADAAGLGQAGALLARRVATERRLGGLLLDGPDGLAPLFEAVRKGMRKPLMAVLEPSQVAAFGQVDVAVVPLFARRPAGSHRAPRSLALDAHRALAASRLEQGLRYSRLAGSRLLAGLPGAAAGGAFEAAAPGPGEPALPSGVTQAEYFQESLDSVTSRLKVGDPAWLGVALWTLRNGDSAADSRGGFWVSPAAPVAQAWQRLRLPLGAR